MISELPHASRFTIACVQLNRLDNFHQWILYPGMLFKSTAKWWGDEGDRKTPHEGIDLRWYADRKGRLHDLGPGAKVPAIWAGEIVNILDDFLGKSIFLRHPIYDHRGWQLHTAYGHTEPLDINIGAKADDGQAIANVADAGGKKAPSHLHVSIAWVRDTPAIDWDSLADPEKASLIDPLLLIDRWAIVERQGDGLALTRVSTHIRMLPEMGRSLI